MSISLATGSSSCEPASHEQPALKRTHLGRVQQLQAQEGCRPQAPAGKQPSNSSTQWSGAASHSSSAVGAAANQMGTSEWAAVANMGGVGKARLAAGLVAQQEQQGGGSAASGQSRGKHSWLVCQHWTHAVVLSLIARYAGGSCQRGYAGVVVRTLSLCMSAYSATIHPKQHYNQCCIQSASKVALIWTLYQNV